MDQKLFVRPHSGSAETTPTDLSSAGDESWIVLSECDESPPDLSTSSALPPSQPRQSTTELNPPCLQQQTAKIEVYEYPEDCIGAELLEHFCDGQARGECLTPAGQIWNAETNTFVLEFYLPDVEVILSQPEQRLDEDEEESRILVRRYTVPVHQVLVTSEQEVTVRQLKKHLKSFGDVRSYDQIDGSKRRFVITFTDAREAGMLAEKKSVKLGTSGTVSVELYDNPAGFEVFRSLTSPQYSNTSTTDDRSDSPMSTASSSLTLNLELSTISTPEHPHDTSVSGGSGAVGSTRDSGAFIPSQAPQSVAITPLKTNIEIKSEVKREPCDQTDDSDRPASAFHIPPASAREDVASPPYTHVQIEKLQDESAKEMFDLLDLHLGECLESGYSLTKFEHSYDESKNVFRFDLRPQDIKELLSCRQLLFQEEEEPALIITPLLTGRAITVTVVENPEKAPFSRKALQTYFGENGGFASTLTILHLQNVNADLELQTCSVASLVVSLGRHSLSNKIVLQADYPGLEGTAEYAPPPTENLVIAETTMSSRLLKKFLSASAGKVVRALEESKYLVEFDRSEKAKGFLERKLVDIRGTEIAFSQYNTETMDEEEEEDEEEEDSDTPEQTYIEIQSHGEVAPQTMYQALVGLLQRALGTDIPITSSEHAHDAFSKVFRFDMDPTGIAKLTGSKQVLTFKDGSCKDLAITAGNTGIHMRQCAELMCVTFKRIYGGCSLQKDI